MKRSERQHLKENPFAEFVFSLREATIGHSREASVAVLVVAAVAVAAGGYFYWQSRRTANAEAALAAAIAVAETPVVPPAPAGTPNQPAGTAGTFPSERARLEAALPRFLDVATAYSSTAAAAATTTITTAAEASFECPIVASRRLNTRSATGFSFRCCRSERFMVSLVSLAIAAGGSRRESWRARLDLNQWPPP